MLHSRVAARHTDDLVVPASLVGHPEHPDRPAVDQTAGKSRLLDQHQRVERITVLAEGLLDEAVVRRVPGRGKEHPVQPDPVGAVIHLVLVALPFRDLDRDVEMHLSSSRSRADGTQRLPSALVSPKRRQPVRRAPCIRKMTNLGGRGVRASRSILLASLAALVMVVAVGAVAVRHNRDAQRTTARSAAVRSPAAVPAPSPPPLLLPEVTDGHPAPTPAGLAAALAPPLADPALGSHVAATVVDAVGAGPLLDQRADEPMAPASTAKLVTAAAALLILGPDTRLVTRVVAGATSEELVLVGGGDPTLVDARPPPGYPPAPSVGNLAAAVAGAGVTRVSRVVVDAGLFAEPRTAPGWRPMYVALGNVAPVTALMVDGGRSRPDRDPRDPDPDLLAGRALLAALGQRGVAVSGATVARGSALPQSRELAAVSSAPVPALVERMLRTSDNDVAEALTRHIALRLGAPAKVAGAPSRRAMWRVNASATSLSLVRSIRSTRAGTGAEETAASSRDCGRALPRATVAPLTATPRWPRSASSARPASRSGSGSRGSRSGRLRPPSTISAVTGATLPRATYMGRHPGAVRGSANRPASTTTRLTRVTPAPATTRVTSRVSGPRMSRAAAAVTSFAVEAGAIGSSARWSSNGPAPTASTTVAATCEPRAGSASGGARAAANPAGVGAGWPSVTSGSSSGGGLGAGTAAGERTAADRAVVRCASRLWRTATAPTATTTTRAARLASRMDRDARTPRPPRFVILRMHGARRTGWRRFGDTNADGKRCVPSARDREELRCISTSRSRSRKGSATSTRWITAPTGSGWTGCSLPRPGTRRTTASSRRPSARTVIRSTRWCWSRSRPFPAV